MVGWNPSRKTVKYRITIHIYSFNIAVDPLMRGAGQSAGGDCASCILLPAEVREAYFSASELAVIFPYFP